MHAIIFGLDFHQDRKSLKKSKTGNALYSSETLDKIWGYGHCQIGDVTYQSCNYVARYINKQLHSGPKLSLIGNMKEPYSTMSRRPGLGTTWFLKYFGDVYPRDEVIMGNKPMKPPTHYDTLYELEHPEEMELIKKARRKAAIKHGITPERKLAIEKCKERNRTIFTQLFFDD